MFNFRISHGRRHSHCRALCVISEGFHRQERNWVFGTFFSCCGLSLFASCNAINICDISTWPPLCIDLHFKCVSSNDILLTLGSNAEDFCCQCPYQQQISFGLCIALTFHKRQQWSKPMMTYFADEYICVINWASQSYPQRTKDAIITSLWRQNDVLTSFWRHNDVIIASCARWGSSGTWLLKVGPTFTNMD